MVVVVEAVAAEESVGVARVPETADATVVARVLPVAQNADVE